MTMTTNAAQPAFDGTRALAFFRDLRRQLWKIVPGHRGEAIVNQTAGSVMSEASVVANANASRSKSRRQAWVTAGS